MTPSLTAKEREDLVLMVAEHRRRVGLASFFECAACGVKKHISDLEGVFPFFPKQRHLHKGMATYVICKICTHKRPDEVYEGVATYLAKQGFFIRA